ncbi:MAG: hypothetical protein Q8M23_09875, partial [Bacteroidales bacterium]|nr:hypothetical protein [Bacteroidales bacterium]
MKAAFYTLILSLMVFCQSVAQNYQTVYSGRISSFEDLYNYVNFIRIDSVAYQNDSILYPFKSIGQLDYNCYTPYGASWIGKKVIIRGDGMNLFFNSNNDTIHIKTNAALNESWIAYQIPGSITITAKVTGHGVQTFLGLQDSVKTIGFQVYNQAMLPITHLLNSKTIKLSKHYGLLRTLNFLHFPDLIFGINGVWSEYLQESDLAGLSQPMLGIQNLTWMEVNDHHILRKNRLVCGDEVPAWLKDRIAHDEEIIKSNLQSGLDFAAWIR